MFKSLYFFLVPPLHSPQQLTIRLVAPCALTMHQVLTIFSDFVLLLLLVAVLIKPMIVTGRDVGYGPK